MMDITSKKSRMKSEKILLEGVRLIKDAINAGVKLETLLYTRIDAVNELNVSKDVKKYKVPYRSIQLWSTLSTSPGIMGKIFFFF